MGGSKPSTATMTCTTGTVALGGPSGPLFPAPLARGRGRRGGRGDFLVLPLFEAPSCRVRQGYWYSLLLTVMLVRRLRQASSPGLRGSCGGDFRLCVRDCRQWERLRSWCHVRQAPRSAVTRSQVANGFCTHFTCDTVRSSLFHVACVIWVSLWWSVPSRIQGHCGSCLRFLLPLAVCFCWCCLRVNSAWDLYASGFLALHP